MKLAKRSPELQELIGTLNIGDEYFWEPLRLVQPGAWSGHLAIAFWLVKVVQPRIFVELGTHSGNSYSAFCQAISQFGLPSRAYAVDTWKGDEQAGMYGESVFQDLNAFNQNHFGRFSRLVRSTFDDARPYFEDGSIDLLHIDGLHTYDAVRHDFETWKSAASPSAVIVFHDVNVRETEFGVWRLWQELSEAYPSFEFHHSEGLGILGFGTNQCTPLKRLFELGRDTQAAFAVRQVFAARGEAFLSRALGLDLEHLVSVHSERAAELDSTRRELSHLQARLKAIEPELDRLRRVEADVREQASKVACVIADAESTRAQAAEYRLTADALEQTAGSLRNELEAVRAQNTSLAEVLNTERERVSSLQSRLDSSASIARQQSLTVQRNLLELQSARNEIDGYKQELENYTTALEHHRQEIEYQKQEIENHRQNLEHRDRQLEECTQGLENYKTAYAQAAALIIPLRVRSAVPASLKPPLRAVKRAVRSLLRRSP